MGRWVRQVMHSPERDWFGFGVLWRYIQVRPDDGAMDMAQRQAAAANIRMYSCQSK